MIIRFYSEFFCYSTWLVNDNGDIDNISPYSLPISYELSHRIEKWEDRYQSIYNDLDPVSSSFKTKKEEKIFLKEGHLLAKQLQKELLGKYDLESPMLYHCDE